MKGLDLLLRKISPVGKELFFFSIYLKKFEALLCARHQGLSVNKTDSVPTLTEFAAWWSET